MPELDNQTWLIYPEWTKTHQNPTGTFRDDQNHSGPNGSV